MSIHSLKNIKRKKVENSIAPTVQAEKFYEYIEFVSIGKEAPRMSPADKCFIVSIESLELVKCINRENIYFYTLLWFLHMSIRYC